MSKLDNIYKEYLNIIQNKPINFEEFNNYSIVHHSTGIEGSTLTLEETFLLLDERLTPKGKPIEHSLMALDHLEALKYVIEISKNKKIISIEDIQKIGSLVMKSTGANISTFGGDFDTSKGEFRKNTVSVGNRLFMDYTKVEGRMKELLNSINVSNEKINNNSISEVYELAFKAHFNMVSIHPFGDGNGRSSRLLMNYIQAFNDKPLTVIFKEDKIDYYLALENTRKNEDINIFIEFMNSQAVKFFKREMDLFKQQCSSKRKGFTFLF